MIDKSVNNKKLKNRDNFKGKEYNNFKDKIQDGNLWTSMIEN